MILYNVNTVFELYGKIHIKAGKPLSVQRTSTRFIAGGLIHNNSIGTA